MEAEFLGETEQVLVLKTETPQTTLGLRSGVEGRPLAQVAVGHRTAAPEEIPVDLYVEFVAHIITIRTPGGLVEVRLTLVPEEMEQLGHLATPLALLLDMVAEEREERQEGLRLESPEMVAMVLVDSF